jgi:hypothetical protein
MYSPPLSKYPTNLSFCPHSPFSRSYSAEWPVEAAARGLPNLRNTVEALATFDSEKNRALFAAMKVLSADELASRSDIMYHTYTHQVPAGVGFLYLWMCGCVVVWVEGP